LNYLKFYPSYRRNFIDKSIFYTNNNYLLNLKRYNKCIKQRNAEFKNKIVNDIWIEQLIEYSFYIVKERIFYVDRINEILQSENRKEDYLLKYQFNNKSDIKTILYEKYNKVKKKEVDYGYTLFGPHMDDFIFTIDKHDFRKFSSEGQKLSFLLNLKYAQLMDFENINKFSPILLFDDIGKELDSQRKSEIFGKFFNKNCQIFITSTNIECFSENSKTFNVENGKFFDLS
jgi:DNA replication and repair protein RecF